MRAEREIEILKILKENTTVRVEELSKILGVSANTIRRDLNGLQEKGYVGRTQGGAVLPRSMDVLIQPVESRRAANMDAKRRIGQKALGLIGGARSIILDSGSTCLELARNLRNHPSAQSLTVLTNSLDNGQELLGAGCTVLLSGGTLLDHAHSLVGSVAEEFFTPMHAEKAFIGARGIDCEHGITNPNLLELGVKRKMIAAAREVVLLSDSDKFGKVALGSICPLSSVHTLVTDTGIPDTHRRSLEKMGITVILC